MLRKTLMFGAVLACGLMALDARSAWADDKDRPVLDGVWAKEGGQMKIEFADKDVLKIAPHGDKDVILVVCSYTIDKEKRVKVKVTELEGQQKDKVKGIVPIGLEFSFSWEVKKDSATLADLKGKDAEPLKGHLEGKYEKK